VIIQCTSHLNAGNASHIPCVGMRASSSGYVYTASFNLAAGGGDNVANCTQGVYPLYNHSGTPSFDYQVIYGFNGGVSITVIGYYN